MSNEPKEESKSFSKDVQMTPEPALINLDSLKLELTTLPKFTFTWISSILTYSFAHKYLIIQDLFQGLCLLSCSHPFTFSTSHPFLPSSCPLLSAHCLSKTLFLAQDDRGQLFLVKIARKNKRWRLREVARWAMGERVTAYLGISKEKDKEVVMCTSEGSVFKMKVLDKEMVDFLKRIQYFVMKSKVEEEDKEKLLKEFENGFGNAFDGNVIQEFFDFDLRGIKELLSEIKQSSIKENNSGLVNFNLLSIKMLLH
jgi:hypothetical protein